MGNYKILNQNICFEDAVAAKNTAVSSNVLSKAIFPNSAADDPRRGRDGLHREK